MPRRFAMALLALAIFAPLAFAKQKCGDTWNYDIWLFAGEYTPAELDAFNAEKPFLTNAKSGMPGVEDEIYIFSADSAKIDPQRGTISAHICGFARHPLPASVVDIEGNVLIHLHPNWPTVLVYHMVRDRHGKIRYEDEEIYGGARNGSPYRLFRKKRTKN